MPPIFYRDASVILVCFDPTSPDVKASIRKWVDMLDEYRPEDSKIILVATKCDLWDNDDDPLIDLVSEGPLLHHIYNTQRPLSKRLFD